MNSGDTVLLKLETTESDPLDRQFALLKVVMTSDDTYVNDIQLKACQEPNVANLWSLYSVVDGSTTFDNTDAGGDANTYIGRINAEESAINNFNDEYSWDYNGNTMLHVYNLVGVDVFSDRLGIDTIQYDWTNDGTFVDDTANTYTEISSSDHNDNIVSVQVTNKKGQVVNNSLYLQLRYNTPVPDITWTPENPSVADDFNITGAIEDVDSVITNIEWKFDDETVDNNTTLDYTWAQDLGDTYIATRLISADTTWNDGFNSHTIEYDETVTTTNLAPTFTIDVTVNGDDNDNDRIFTPVNLTDPDGDDADLELRWTIEYKTPFNNLWTMVQDLGYPSTPNLDQKEWIFSVSGDYKVTAIAKDGSGLETRVETVVSFETLAGGGQATGRIKLNNNVWQLIAIPVQAKNVHDYFLNNIEAQLQTYDGDKTISDAIEVVNAYMGHEDKFRSFVPGVTNTSSPSNFPLTVDDGTVKEIVGFWVKMKDYYAITNNEPIIFNWDQAD